MKVWKRRAKSHLYAYASLSTLMLTVLSACADDGIKPEPHGLAQQTIPPEFQVRAKVAHHPLLVTPTTGEISDYERQNLDGFLAGLAAGNPQALHVRITGVSSSEAKAQLFRILVTDGLEPSKIEFMAGSVSPARINYNTASAAPSSNHSYYNSSMDHYGAPIRVDIAAEIYSVIPPSCPRLSRVRIAGNDNGVDSNWGCSTVSVFEQMVADPRDLVHGESGGTTDSEVTSGAIDRMRKDKLKPLQDSGSVTLGAGGGGGGS